MQKRGGKVVSIADGPAVLWTRVRGLHLSQAGVYKEPTSASLFDLALLAYKIDFSRLKHPLAIYIPKTESAEEALWWRDAFAAIAVAKGQPADAIKCMALVESHPFAYQIEEFAYTLRDHLLGLNLGRWDYMASLIHFNLDDPDVGAARPQHDPDRRAVLPSAARTHSGNLPSARAARDRRHDRALSGSQQSRAQHTRARSARSATRKTKPTCLFDGAWTGHPDQNAIAVAQFPEPNQGLKRKPGREPDARPAAVDRRRRHENGRTARAPRCAPSSATGTAI